MKVTKSSGTENKNIKSEFKLTINDRILLHLLDNVQSKNKREAPYSITQKGIAEGVKIRWNHVPRAVGRLKKMGYLSEEMSHIEGKTRRQKAYYLTDSGMLFARNLREKILGFMVHLVKTDGQVERIKLSEINSTLKLNVSPFKLFMKVSDDGEILESELQTEIESKVPEKTTKTFFVKGEILWPEELIGREKEIKVLSDWISSTSQSTLVIYGSVGIGKSALMVETIKIFRGKKDIFWYEMSDSDSQKEIVQSLSEFLIELDKTTLSSYLSKHESYELNEVIRILEKGFKDIDTILAFDNYFQVSEEVADFFSGLCVLASKYRNLKLFINAMDTTPFYCRFYDKNEIKKKKIGELTIKGLKPEGIKKMLNTPDIDDDALRKIHLMTRGHPLTIELIKKGDVNSLKRIKGFSRQEASLLLYLKTVERK
jgi:DNA-binding MarR family transcriptional regulator